MFFDNLSLIVQQELQIYNVQFCFKKEGKKNFDQKKMDHGRGSDQKKKTTKTTIKKRKQKKRV